MLLDAGDSYILEAERRDEQERGSGGGQIFKHVVMTVLGSLAAGHTDSELSTGAKLLGEESTVVRHIEWRDWRYYRKQNEI